MTTTPSIPHPERILAILAAPFLFLFFLGFFGALPASGAVTDLDAEAPRQLIETLCQQLIDEYIYVETAEKMAADLQRRHRAGEYDTITAPRALADQLTHDLQAISHDAHLRVRYGQGHGGHGAGGAGAVGPRTRRVMLPVDADADRAARHPDMVADASGHSNPEIVRKKRRERAPMERTAATVVGKVEMLPGQIAYLRFDHFGADEEVNPHIDRAMETLQGARALIIDVGQNPGGTPHVIRYVSTYLFEGPTHLTTTFGRGWPGPMERWTFDAVPGERFADIPVFVLTSGRTFSAAESFTFGLKVNQRITQVGERTGGGGHWGEQLQLGNGFRMFMPKGRTYDPETGKGWEAEGIEPEIRVPYEEAFETALAAARAAIARDNGETVR